jgi:hypothetical protein
VTSFSAGAFLLPLPLYTGNTAAATAIRSICDINAELNESCKQMARFPLLLEYSWKCVWQKQCARGGAAAYNAADSSRAQLFPCSIFLLHFF